MSADAAPRVALGDVAHVQQGKWLPLERQLGGRSRVFGANGVTGYTTSGHHPFPVVALGCRGSCGTLHIAPADSWIGNNAMALWPKDRGQLDLGFLRAALAVAGTEKVTKTTAQPMIARGDLVRLQIPLPSLPNQRRIVSLLDGGDCYVEALEIEVGAAIAAKNAVVSDLLARVCATAPIGSVLTTRTDKITLDDDSLYTQVTVSGAGRGMRLREHRYGRDIGTKQQCVLHAGDLIISRIDARRGAMCVIPDEFTGAVVTSGFPTFAIVAEKVDPAYLDLVVRSTAFAKLCDSISAGTTNRVAADMKRFPALPIPLPPLGEQHRIVAIAADTARRCGAVSARLAAARLALDQLLHDLLSGNHQIPDSYDRFLTEVA